jgi:molecular chaperone HscB
VVAVSPSSFDAFAVFGLPRRYPVDLADLEKRYRELSRKHHPDRFVTAPAAERVRALGASTALNDAYRLLKRPDARAQHLLALSGMGITEADRLPQDFLVDVLELREALAEARAGGDTAARAALEADVQARQTAAMSRVEAALSAEPPDLAAAKADLMTLRYFDRFLAEAAGHDLD